MKGKGIRIILHRFVSSLMDWTNFLAIVLGFSIAWNSKETLFTLVFPASSTEISTSVVIGLTFLAGLFFSAILAGIFYLLRKIVDRIPKSKPLNTRIDIKPETRLNIALGIISVGLIVALFVNNVLPSIDTTQWTIIPPKTIPPLNPVGNDFRTGLYRPPQALFFQGAEYTQQEDGTFLTQYPPLVNLLYLPFQFLSENQAYLVQVFLLFCANLACLGMAALWVRDFILPHAGLDKRANTLLAWFLFLTGAALSFTSYPFLFTIERGNYDLMAMFFAMLAINNLLRKPNQVWVQVILLSIAAHLKIYPAALFIILLAKHGRKMILPALAVNVAFLFSLGPKNAMMFIQIILHSVSTGFPWVGNHSGFSFGTYLSWVFQSAEDDLAFLRTLFATLPIVVWIISAFALLKQKLGESSIVLLVMASIPLMDVLPPISHDYKSVILYPALIMISALLLVKIMQTPGFGDYIQFVLIMGLFLIIGRSFALNAEELILINNKYIVILTFAVLMLFNLIGIRKKSLFVTPACEAG